VVGDSAESLRAVVVEHGAWLSSNCERQVANYRAFAEARAAQLGVSFDSLRSGEAASASGGRRCPPVCPSGCQPPLQALLKRPSRRLPLHAITGGGCIGPAFAARLSVYPHVIPVFPGGGQKGNEARAAVRVAPNARRGGGGPGAQRAATVAGGARD
jgi:hypothetical protein